MHMGERAEGRGVNRLAGETSPYLLQHADNPVDWYPWGPEAMERARTEDRPILLSIGYAACHWCHVMEHESFEDPATAAVMNEHFVSVKVDREERPDLDAVYMEAVVAMSGHGGWPMTVFLTPAGEPFYGGTYYPPEPRHSLPGFRQVLVAVSDAYRDRRADVARSAKEIVEAVRRSSELEPSREPLTDSLLYEALGGLRSQLDPEWGGFGRAPKFPPASVLEFLLRRGELDLVTRTLDGMAAGGMYDLVGGGFHRYSVDEQWLVPHFEKMLYDNALLAHIYAETFQATGDLFYRRIAEETLDYMAREMRHPDGGFYSTQDADSLAPEHGEKEEGAFFVWTPAEVREVLGGDALIFAQVFDVTERGNFEGKNILHLMRRPADVARVTGMPAEQIEELIARSKRKLFEARERRPKPDLDDKVLTAWNGMALRAFAHAARALGRDDYRDIARQNAEFLPRELRRGDVVLRTWKDVNQSTNDERPATQNSKLIPGFLED